MSDKPQSNPAVVGLAGFGGTTLLLQFHNLGLCGAGSVFWTAVFFGGLMQLIAGFQEFKTGNNFGYAAFSTYGAFWLALGGCLIGTQYGILKISMVEIGWFLVVFTLITCVFFIGTLKQNGMVAFLFLTLLLGFICLDLSFLGGMPVFTVIAGIDLIICALTAWYLMAHGIFTQFGWNLPVGEAWIK
ncbi:MAG: acetate uptake transporter [Dehalococcoidia bacterium]|nr:acetate uptake transporter [Dehalococcoidia bacterium]